MMIKKRKLKKMREIKEVGEGGFSTPEAFAYYHNQATAAAVSQFPSTQKIIQCSPTLLIMFVSMKI